MVYIIRPRQSKMVKPKFGTVKLNPHHPHAQDLALSYLFNEGGGNVVLDHSGYGAHLNGDFNDANFTGRGSWMSATYGPCWRGLNTNNDALRSARGTASHVMCQNFTYEHWFRRNTDNYERHTLLCIVDDDSPNDTMQLFFQRYYWITASIGLDPWGTGYSFHESTTHGSQDFYLDDWHHVAVTFTENGAEAYFYEDGQFVNSGSDKINAGNTTKAAARVDLNHCVKFGNPYCGYFDHWYANYWNRVLTPEEVMERYQNPFGMFTPTVARRRIYAVGDAAATLTGTPIALSITIPQPDIDLGANTLTGTPISLSITLPSPALDAPVTFTGTSLALSVTVPAPGAELAANILTGAPIALSVTAVTPSVDLAANILAGTPIALSVAIATPSIDVGADATLTLDPISLTPAIALSTIDAPVILALDPVTLSVTVVAPEFASAFASVADTVREITAVSGKNQIIIITGPIALTAGDEIRVVGKVSTYDTSSEWLADESTISLFKV